MNRKVSKGTIPYASTPKIVFRMNFRRIAGVRIRRDEVRSRNTVSTKTTNGIPNGRSGNSGVIDNRLEGSNEEKYSYKLGGSVSMDQSQ